VGKPQLATDDQTFKNYNPVLGEYLSRTAGASLAGGGFGCDQPVAFETVPFPLDGDSVATAVREQFAKGTLDFAVMDRIGMACLGQELHVKELLSVVPRVTSKHAACPLVFTRADSQIRTIQHFKDKVCAAAMFRSIHTMELEYTADFLRTAHCNLVRDALYGDMHADPSAYWCIFLKA
jgi:hypothetical protein